MPFVRVLFGLLLTVFACSCRYHEVVSSKLLLNTWLWAHRLGVDIGSLCVLARSKLVDAVAAPMGSDSVEAVSPLPSAVVAMQQRLQRWQVDVVSLRTVLPDRLVAILNMLLQGQTGAMSWFALFFSVIV
jgi:hypothetical protein